MYLLPGAPNQGLHTSPGPGRGTDGQPTSLHSRTQRSLGLHPRIQALKPAQCNRPASNPADARRLASNCCPPSPRSLTTTSHLGLASSLPSRLHPSLHPSLHRPCSNRCSPRSLSAPMMAVSISHDSRPSVFNDRSPAFACSLLVRDIRHMSRDA